MARAKRKRSKHEGVYHRDLRDGRVYDIAYRTEGKLVWESNFPTLDAALDRRDELRYLTRHGARIQTKRRLYRDFIKDDYLPWLEARVAQGELRTAHRSAVQAATFETTSYPSSARTASTRSTFSRSSGSGDALTSAGLPTDLVKRIITTLGYTLKLARKWRLIAYNPVADTDKPQARRRTPSLPTVRDVQRLANAMPTRETSTLVLFAAFTGTRKSECFALRWTDIDLAKGAELATIVRQFYKGELRR